MLISILEIIFIIIPILGSIAYLTLAERKVMGYSINKKPLNKLYEKNRKLYSTTIDENLIFLFDFSKFILDNKTGCIISYNKYKQLF